MCSQWVYFGVVLCCLTPSCPPAVSEEQCLYQIYLDELYGGLPKPNEDEKKKYELNVKVVSSSS